MTTDFEQARQHFIDGIGHYEAGRFEPAEQAFTRADSLAPGRPSVLTNLGAARVKLERHSEAIDPLERAVAAEPDNIEAWSHLSFAEGGMNAHDKALVAADRAIALGTVNPLLWIHHGSLLHAQGRFEEASRSFERALELGGDSELVRYFLAGTAGQSEAPPAPPRSYVERLFDSYADGFEAHLVGTLRYRGPEILLGRLPPTRSGGERQLGVVLDLGCGTGLCGPLLRERARRVEGVDLSERMVEASRKTGVYDALAHADAVDYLREQPEGRYSLVVACDVLIYVGALDPVFAQVARVLQPGGLFAFTVERSDGADLVLNTSMRYSHSPASVERLATAHGFRVVGRIDAPIREEQGVPMPGLYYHLERV